MSNYHFLSFLSISAVTFLVQLYSNIALQTNIIQFHGDKNSTFHATVNQRRQRNQLVRLKSGHGDWISDEDGINEQIGDFFSNLFSQTGARDYTGVLNIVDQCITNGMNASLTRPITHAEIPLWEAIVVGLDIRFFRNLLGLQFAWDLQGSKWISA